MSTSGSDGLPSEAAAIASESLTWWSVSLGFLGTSTPRVGTIFVVFADGTRHEIPLRMGTRAEMQKVDAAIARFNAMADAAAPGQSARP